MENIFYILIIYMKNNNIYYRNVEQLYKQKYLKYKQKYTELKAQTGGVLTWEDFLNKNITKFHLEDKHAIQWDIIREHIKKIVTGVIDPNIVIQRYLINHNTEKTIQGAMDLLYTKWWLDPTKYSAELFEEKNIIKRNDDARKAADDARKAADDAQAQKEGYKDASDKYTKVKAADDAQAQKEGYKDARDKYTKVKAANRRLIR
jgi:hypothetical protein